MILGNVQNGSSLPFLNLFKLLLIASCFYGHFSVSRSHNKDFFFKKNAKNFMYVLHILFEMPLTHSLVNRLIFFSNNNNNNNFFISTTFEYSTFIENINTNITMVVGNPK